MLKVAALVALIGAGLAAHPAHGHPITALSSSTLGTLGILGAFSVAMIPVLFAYNGAMVANFMAGEARERRLHVAPGPVVGDLRRRRAYLLVNAACVRVLGVHGLANTPVPAAAVLRAAAGSAGAQVASFSIAVSTLGFIGNRMLTIPRLYHAMARRRAVLPRGGVDRSRRRACRRRDRVASSFAMLLALSGSYEHILNYVVSTFSSSTVCWRSRSSSFGRATVARAPRKPCTSAYPGTRSRPRSTSVVSWGVAIATYVAYPRDAIVGVAILLSAVPVYFLWVRTRL